MKIVRNRWIPFKGFWAINLFGVIFVRKDLPEEHLSDPLWLETIIRHERIHTRQMVELLVIPFYLLYICGVVSTSRYLSKCRECLPLYFIRAGGLCTSRQS